MPGGRPSTHERWHSGRRRAGTPRLRAVRTCGNESSPIIGVSCRVLTSRKSSSVKTLLRAKLAWSIELAHVSMPCSRTGALPSLAQFILSTTVTS